MLATEVRAFFDTQKCRRLRCGHFELSVEDLEEIYKRRRAIETLYKQLKLNFPLHFFYGDSINAIQIQTWTVLSANLLCTIISRKLKRHVSFSQIVTLIRMTLMYYVDLISFLENPNKEELKIRSEKEISPHIQLLLFE